MRKAKNKNYLLAWIEKQQSWGKYTFSLNQIKQEFHEISEVAILLALSRLSKKNRIVSIYKSFYLIVPPEYSAKGILPPVQFIDDLMNFIDKPYYVGLLSAAALHGAAHQQPQEYFVVTSTKQITTKKRGIKINYFTKKKISDNLLYKIKTETGYVKVSTPELTAADLVYYQNRVGGINRVCSVINELSEEIKPGKITGDLVDTLSAPTIQRLGYLFDRLVNQPELARKLYQLALNRKIKFYMQPLTPGGKRTGFKNDKKWKVIINTEVEFDE